MEQRARELESGAILSGSYQLVRELARGGMGTIWEARHLRLSSAVAVKVLHGVGDASTEAFRRFRREAEIASQLGHPHIIKALDFDSLPDGSPFLVMELLRGESLRERLGRGRLGLEETVDLTGQIASALHAAHRVGVVHRDLKPDNIFLSVVPVPESAHAVLLDFGISKLLSSNTALTQEGTVFGTPQYMAPEQANQAETGGETDQYALATIIYEMLCGEPAFEAGPPLHVLFRVVNHQPPPLSERFAGVPAAVSTVVARGMAKAPAERFADVLDFARALAGAAGFSGRIALGPASLPTLPPVDLETAASDARRLAVEPTLPTPNLQLTAPASAPRPRRLWIRGVVAAAAIARGVGAVLLFSEHAGERLPSPRLPPPPPAAIEVCTGKTAGAACRFTDRAGVLWKGRCWSPRPNLPLACAPPGKRR